MKYQKENVKKKKNLWKSHQKNKIKYLGINLTKDVKDLYAENCKTLIKEIEDYLKMGNGRNILCYWIGTINVVKMSLLPK